MTTYILYLLYHIFIILSIPLHTILIISEFPQQITIFNLLRDYYVFTFACQFNRFIYTYNNSRRFLRKERNLYIDFMMIESFSYGASRMNNSKLFISITGFLNNCSLERMEYHAQRSCRCCSLRIVFIGFSIDILFKNYICAGRQRRFEVLRNGNN